MNKAPSGAFLRYMRVGSVASLVVVPSLDPRSSISDGRRDLCTPGEACNGISIVCALVSGAAWHSSTVGSAAPALTAITSGWNVTGSLFALGSALLGTIGFFPRKR